MLYFSDKLSFGESLNQLNTHTVQCSIGNCFLMEVPIKCVNNISMLSFLPLFFFFWPSCVAYRMLVSWLGIKSTALVVEAWSSNHWSLIIFFLIQIYSFWCLSISLAVQSEMKWKLLSCVPLLETPWSIQSMEFYRAEYWSGQPISSPGDLPNQGIEPRSPTLLADSLPAELPGKLDVQECVQITRFNSACQAK